MTPAGSGAGADAVGAASSTQTVPTRGAVLAVVGFSVTLSLLSMGVPALVDHPVTTGRGELRLYLDVLEEGNLPTWWSTALLVFAGLLHLGVGLLAALDAGVRRSWAWFVTGGLLVLLSLDDHTSLHERLDTVGALVLDITTFPFLWLVPGVLAGVLVAAAFGVLARRLVGPPRRYLAAGCSLLLLGALGGELVQGLLLGSGDTGPRYVLTYHAEELLENLGVLLLGLAAARSVVVGRQGRGLTLAYRSGPARRVP